MNGDWRVWRRQVAERSSWRHDKAIPNWQNLLYYIVTYCQENLYLLWDGRMGIE